MRGGWCVDGGQVGHAAARRGRGGGAVGAALERQRALDGRAAGGCRGCRAPRTPCGRCGGRPSGRSSAPARRGARPVLAHPAPVAGDERAHVAHRRAHADPLDVPDRLAQPAVLVEVAAHELDRRVVVRVQHAGARRVGLPPRGVRGQRAAERLVLAVRDVVEADLLPARPAVRRVHVGEERRVVGAEHARRVAVGGERREELDQLARDHRARVRPREMRAEDGADVGVERERLAQRGEPAGHRRRVLGEEGDDLGARPLGAEVARAAVPELGRRDLEHLDAGARGRSPTEPSREPESMTSTSSTRLARERGEQLGQVARTVLDGDDDGDARRHPREAPLERLERADDGAHARRTARGTRRRRAGASARSGRAASDRASTRGPARRRSRRSPARRARRSRAPAARRGRAAPGARPARCSCSSGDEGSSQLLGDPRRHRG